MPIEFKEGGSGYSLGVEEELHIVDATTGELVQKIEEIMSRLPTELHESVSYELFQSVMEIKTPPLRLDLRGREAPARATQSGRLVGRSMRCFARLRGDPSLFPLQGPEGH